MADEPAISNAELARRIDHLGTDLHDDLKRIEDRLPNFVSRDVYEAQRAAAEERLRAVSAAAEDKHTALAARVATLETRGRWLIAFVVMPLLVVLLDVLLRTKGVSP